MTPGDQWRLLVQRLHVDLRRVTSAGCRLTR
ncbi:putative leader peptide [Saccharopolyspora phatthalungensis]